MVIDQFANSGSCNRCQGFGHSETEFANALMEGAFTNRGQLIEVAIRRGVPEHIAEEFASEALAALKKAFDCRRLRLRSFVNCACVARDPMVSWQYLASTVRILSTEWHRSNFRAKRHHENILFEEVNRLKRLEQAEVQRRESEHSILGMLRRVKQTLQKREWKLLKKLRKKSRKELGAMFDMRRRALADWISSVESKVKAVMV